MIDVKRRLNLIFDEYNKIILLSIFLLVSIILGIFLKSTSIFVCLILIFIILFIYNIKNLIYIDKLTKKLNERELKLIESEIKKPLINEKNKYIITDHYIIKKGLKIALIKYCDIVLVYRKNRYNIFKNNSNFETIFVIVDNKNKKYKFLLSSFGLPIFDEEPFIENVIRNRNSKVLFGYSKNNINEIKRKYNFKIRK